ncbi:glycerophosphodiester phosphodiesterase [Rathayibacter sp. YIM 133350]|uniref:glycerophosphodiester phosphodiesterase n=1 Tax=Rathayibacter sp. YIM 133350 TaxID=3131992 RepID=UPI00307D4EC5
MPSENQTPRWTPQAQPVASAPGRSAHPRDRDIRGRLREDVRLLGAAVHHTRSAFAFHLGSIALIHAITIFLAVPAIARLFQFGLDAASIANVTDRTVGALVANPLADLLLVLIAGIALAVVVMQLATTLVIADRQQEGTALAVPALAADVLRVLRELRRRAPLQRPLLLVYLLAVVPLGGLGLFSFITRGIAVPPFISAEFMKSTGGALVYSTVVIGLFLLNARLVYTVPALVIARLTPLAAMATSIRMTRRRVLHVPVMILIPFAVAALASSGVVEMVVDLVGWGSPSSRATTIAASVAIGVGSVIGFTLTAGTALIVVNVLVAETRDHLGLAVVPPAPIASTRRRRIVRRVTVRLVAGAVAAALAFSVAPAVASPVSAAADTVVLAHRGFIGGGAENTIGALEAAVATHPDYVETDMQQTLDGGFVASHDSNLLMVAGINRNIYDMTLDEVTHTSISVHGFTAKIPTMAEYVRRAEQLRMPLLIELKVHGHEKPGFVEDFLRQLDALGATELNIYHSLDPSVVEVLKRLRPELRVGLTIAMSAGGVPASACDFFVIEQASFTRQFLDDAHALGKPVYVWTVDGDDRIRQFLRIPVDGIVTDQPDDAVRYRALMSAKPDPELVTEDSLRDFSVFR